MNAPERVLPATSTPSPPSAGATEETAAQVVPPEEVVTRADVVRRLPGRRRELVAVIEPVWAARDEGATTSVPADVSQVRRAALRLARHLGSGEVVAPTPDGRLRLRLRREDKAARPARLQEMAYHAIEAFDADRSEAGQGRPSDAVGRAPMIDLGVGWAPITPRQSAREAEEHASAAAEDSLRQRDLQPRQRGVHHRVRHPRVDLWSTGHQVLLASVGALLAPFAALVVAYSLGVDLSPVLYWVLTGSFVLTAGMIWAELTRALDPDPLPEPGPEPAPPATAVIAAYLPNEADTVVETVHAFLAQDYEPGLQVVLAYNTPLRLPVEAELHQLAAEHPDLTVLEVPDSTSKAQNVNAALRVAEGGFVGIFDADHHPAPGSFARAWRWLGDPDDPADVVQGHCVIRNGEESALARLVAVEFEQIYAVSHPGRAALHGFGIFGGSNGYWRASALERIRLRGSFLTEDIEASMRVLAAGGRIVNDPGLVSRELAPATPRALWKQRMRWAQGWFQVSCRHLGPLLRSPDLGWRQKAGAAYLMGWREVYPWLSVLTWPLLAFLAWRDEGLDLASPLFALVSLFVLVSGPMQTLAAWRLAAPEVRRHGWWFVGAALANLVFYTEAKNLVNRVAQIKQLRGEHQWVVTPRTTTDATAPATAIHEEAA